MANLIKDGGKWGPIEEGNEKSYFGRQIVIDFDAATSSGIHYTAPLGVPISTETEFIWNTEATAAHDDSDITVYWQGTDDPSVANAAYGGGANITASDTGWTSVAILTLTGSGAVKARETVNLSGVSNVAGKSFTRFKFVHATNAVNDIDITCRVTPLPTISKITHTVAL